MRGGSRVTRSHQNKRHRGFATLPHSSFRWRATVVVDDCLPQALTMVVTMSSAITAIPISKPSSPIDPRLGPATLRWGLHPIGHYQRDEASALPTDIPMYAAVVRCFLQCSIAN